MDSVVEEVGRRDVPMCSAGSLGYSRTVSCTGRCRTPARGRGEVREWKELQCLPLENRV